MLRLERVSKSFGKKVVLNDISVEVPGGELVGVIGPSGGGKSVLLKIIGRVLPPDSGTVSFTTPDGDSKPTVGFLFQEGALFDSMNVLENVSFPLLMSGDLQTRPAAKQAAEQAYEMLGEVGLSDAYRKLPGQLSGGMRRRVALARALVHRPELVLLDDPTGGLDPVAASVIMDLIRHLHRTYTPTALLVSHDLRRLLPNVSGVLGLFGGKLVLQAKPQEIEAVASPQVKHFIETRFDFQALRGLANGRPANAGVPSA